MAIGARSQSAKTFLEKHIGTIETLSKEELIHHALLAIRDTLPIDSTTLIPGAISIGVVGKDQDFVVIEDEEEIKAFIDKLPPVPVSSGARGDEEEAPVESQQQQPQQPQEGVGQEEGQGMDVEQP